MWGWCTSLGWSGPWGMGGGGLFSSGLLGLVLIGALVWAITAGRRRSGDANHRQGARADRDDALRILKRRLALGEIDLEEYERLRQAVDS